MLFPEHPFNTRSGYTALLWTRCPRSESALRRASTTLDKMNLEKAIAEIEWLERLYFTSGYQTASVVRPLCRQPKARRDEREQSVVSAVETVWGLIVSTVFNALLHRHRWHVQRTDPSQSC